MPPDRDALAKDYDRHKDGPYAWIQWKGTDACLDINCSCGHLGHVDATFAYNVRCVACGKVWCLPGYLAMYEATDDDLKLNIVDAH